MTWCGPRSVLARGLVVLAAAATGLHGEPAGHAQPAAELARAKELYLAAEAAVRDERFDDAIRDYGASYELSRDPALFYKLGRAHERAGRCQAAVAYYARYLRDGTPSAQFAALTRERITACGGDPDSVHAPNGPVGSGSATSRSDDAGSAPPPGGPRSAPARAEAQPTAPAGAAPVESPAPALRLIPSTPHQVAWLLCGSTIALAALGGVLAYATDSSENDIRDLYAGLGGRTAAYDAATQRRYRELLDEGRRYERLSWTAFGLAGATAVGAAVLFAIGRDEPAEPARVAPVISAHSAGVAVRF